MTEYDSGLLCFSARVAARVRRGDDKPNYTLAPPDAMSTTALDAREARQCGVFRCAWPAAARWPQITPSLQQHPTCSQPACRLKSHAAACRSQYGDGTVHPRLSSLNLRCRAYRVIPRLAPGFPRMACCLVADASRKLQISVCKLTPSSSAMAPHPQR